MGGTSQQTPAPDYAAAPSEATTEAAPLMKPEDAQVKRIALLLPLSGPDQALGQAMLNAAQMALADAGANNIELVPKDTGAKVAAEAAQKITLAAEEAVSEKASLVLGPVFSSAAAQAKPVMASAKIPMITFSNDSRLAGYGTFVLGPLQYDQVATVLTHAKQLGRSRVTVIAGNDAFGNAIVNSANIYAQQNVFPAPQVVRLVEDSPASWRATLAKYFVAGSEPQAVLIAFRGAALSNIAQTLTAMGFPPEKLLRLGASSWFEQPIPNAGALEGGVVAAPDPQYKKRFVDNYTKLFKSTPPVLAGYAYDAVALAAVLARQPDASFSSAQLASPSGFIGNDGLFRFLPNGLNQRALALWQFRNGKLEIIQPAVSSF